MKNTLYLELNKHNIYLLEDDNISFYISVPKSEVFPSTNISIDLKDTFNKINPNTNDLIYVKDELKNIYEDIDYENITLVIPLFKNNILDMIKNTPSQNLFIYLDKCITYIINNAYIFLTQSKINVNTKIIIINNDKFQEFITWFEGRYQSRIDTKQYAELLGEFTSVIPVLNTQAISNIPTEKKENNNKIEVNENRGGFISYLLLGIIGIVLTLIILYLLL